MPNILDGFDVLTLPLDIILDFNCLYQKTKDEYFKIHWKDIPFDFKVNSVIKKILIKNDICPVEDYVC